MPKLKTKSGVKKRFTLTATGKIRRAHAGKRHGMVKRSKRSLRENRGTCIVTAADTKILMPYIPYGLK